MVLAFTGEHTQKVDKKGRMSIPAPYRRVLESGDPKWAEGLSPRVVIVYGQHLKNELQAYTVAEHEKIVGEIYAMPRERTADKKRLAHLMITQSTELEVDKDGRVILPLKLREKLKIEEGEIYFRGMGDSFEMWNQETFQSTVGADIDSWLDDMPDDFDPLSVLGGS